MCEREERGDGGKREEGEGETEKEGEEVEVVKVVNVQNAQQRKSKGKGITEKEMTMENERNELNVSDGDSECARYCGYSMCRSVSVVYNILLHAHLFAKTHFILEITYRWTFITTASSLSLTYSFSLTRLWNIGIHPTSLSLTSIEVQM